MANGTIETPQTVQTFSPTATLAPTPYLIAHTIVLSQTHTISFVWTWGPKKIDEQSLLSTTRHSPNGAKLHNLNQKTTPTFRAFRCCSPNIESISPRSRPLVFWWTQAMRRDVGRLLGSLCRCCCTWWKATYTFNDASCHKYLNQCHNKYWCYWTAVAFDSTSSMKVLVFLVLHRVFYLARHALTPDHDSHPKSTHHFPLKLTSYICRMRTL